MNNATEHKRSVGLSMICPTVYGKKICDGDVESLQHIYEGLLNRVRAARKCSLAELLSAINSSEFTLSRNFSVEHFVPNYARGREKKCFTAIR